MQDYDIIDYSIDIDFIIYFFLPKKLNSFSGEAT